MSKTVTRHMSPTAGALMSQKLNNQEFARRLHELLMERGWSQSDLARRCFGTMKNSAGTTVARGRDRISMYLRGKAVPDPANLHKIVEALECKLEDLAPDIAGETVAKEEPEFYIHKVPGHNHAFLKVEKLVPLEVAYQIYGILLRNDALTSPSPLVRAESMQKAETFETLLANGEEAKLVPLPEEVLEKLPPEKIQLVTTRGRRHRGSMREKVASIEEKTKKSKEVK